MAYMTDEAMDEFAQWQHDSAWEFESEEFDIRPGDMMEDCPHDNATIHDYDYFKVWECADCGRIGEVGKEF